MADAAAAATGQEPITPVPSPPHADARIVALGHALFEDPALAGDGHHSCASCHDLSTNGADGTAFSPAASGGHTRFNSISVFNAGLAYRLNWQGDEPDLESLTVSALASPQVMGSSVDQAVAAVRRSQKLEAQFEEIYHHKAEGPDLLAAIATFERSLVTPDSRFDQWLKGDSRALTPTEWSGYELFKSFGCVSCHQGVDIGGNLFERSGIYHPVDGDMRPMLLVPSLRNVAVTAPYFHDGSVGSLEEAVARMGEAQLDRALTADQIEQIAAFLRTLTGRYRGQLLTPPK